MTEAFEAIRAALEPSRRVLVASHVRPDGDAIGCTLAFALHLLRQGRQVVAWNADGLPAKFACLPYAHLLQTPPSQPQLFDVVVALDTSTRERLGACWEAVEGSPPVLNIDHHVSNEGFGAVNCVDPSSPATGQIVYEYLAHFREPLDGGIAENLFAAIATDTGSFQFRGVSARTFRAAAALVESGVDVAELSKALYDSQPRRRFDLLRHALNHAQFTCDDTIASFTLTLSDAAALGVLPEDTEGIIDHLRSVEGVVVAVFFEELEGGIVRASVRSKDARVDACEVCRQFGGGGHPLAAGARVAGKPAEVVPRLINALCDAIRNRD